ncbi:NAD-dependent epimerase/dehydratase family protein [Streptomyces sp. NPDC020141]|uniref:NAD-dependent epimerase/dehydratase family protein n=1 Tax=Streptomyces sp. NPDC020141 TaxID=3365065 RepID=UPI0037B35827
MTGAGGFIGGRVAAAARAVPGARVILMSRSPLPDRADRTHHSDAADPADASDRSESGDRSPSRDRSASGDPAVRHVRADLRDPASLRGVCDGVDIVLHCAVRIGGPDPAVRAVNEHGTRALVAEAERAGVGRLVQVSTASVYGRGVFRDAEPSGLPIAPGSETSRSRAAAEHIVLAAGGTVLRPHLVVGAGDRWAVPGLVRLHRRLAATVDGWRALLSAVDVDDLARAVTAVATAPGDASGVWHPNHPAPMSCADVFTALEHGLGLPPATADIGVEEARRRLAGDSVSLHHLAMLTTDHWFASTRLWKKTGCPPGRGLAESLARHAPWYRRHLGLSVPPG